LAVSGLSYSTLNALTGLTDEARRAGIKLANKAEPPNTAATNAMSKSPMHARRTAGCASVSLPPLRKPAR
jgi:hypothetical protein